MVCLIAWWSNGLFDFREILLMLELLKRDFLKLDHHKEALLK